MLQEWITHRIYSGGHVQYCRYFAYRQRKSYLDEALIGALYMAVFANDLRHLHSNYY